MRASAPGGYSRRICAAATRFATKGAIALDAAVDHDPGLVSIAAKSWPCARIIVAPEVALELARRLVAEVAALSRPPRRRR
jgi:hypothetical protein